MVELAVSAAPPVPARRAAERGEDVILVRKETNPEDLHGMRMLLDDLFASMGQFRVVAAKRTEAEAYLWLEENPGGWDVAIVDLVLEQGSGLGVIRPARDASAQARIVVLSSYATPGIEEHCRRLGADAVFDKSNEIDALVDYCLALGERPGSSA